MMDNYQVTTNNTYLFYSSEGWTQAPDGIDVENCQLLGSASAINQEDALEELLKDNPWIQDHQYSLSNIKAIQVANT